MILSAIWLIQLYFFLEKSFLAIPSGQCHISHIPSRLICPKGEEENRYNVVDSLIHKLGSVSPSLRVTSDPGGVALNERSLILMTTNV